MEKKKLDPSCTYYKFCKIFCIAINALFGTNLCFFPDFLSGAAYSISSILDYHTIRTDDKISVLSIY